MLTKITCLVIILFVKITIIYAQINKILPSVNDKTCQNKLAGNIMQLVNTCYTETLDMVVFAGTFHKFENWHTRFSPLLTMYNVGLDKSTLFNRHKRFEKVYRLDENVVSKLHYPSGLFIISSSSQFKLPTLLSRLKQSVVWNSRATFFLVEQDLTTKCSNASFELKEAWKFNILYAFYVCFDENETRFYTFDPFKQVAPDSWKMLETININYKNRSDSLAILQYSPSLTVIDRSTCKRLDLDKTADFNGYTIKIIAHYNHNMFERKDKSNVTSTDPQPLARYKGVDAEVMNAAFHKLALKALVTISYHLGSIDENNQAYGIISELLEGRYDIGANERYRRGIWQFETYPHDMSDMCVITSRRIYQLPITDGLTLLMSHPQALMIFTLMIFVAIVIIKRVLKLAFVAAALELLRLLIGMPMFREIDHLLHGWRLVLINIVILSYWVNLYFGTQLTSSFAIKRDDPNINDIEDLIESGYDISGDRSFQEFLHSPTLNDRFKGATITDCFRDMLPRGNVACIVDCYQANYYVLKLCEHKSSAYISDAIYSTYVAYIVREDWPLLPRINYVMRSFSESGIYLQFNVNNFYHSEGFYEEKEKEEMKMNNDMGFQGKPLSPKKLINSFYLYNFGVVAGLAAFLAELGAKFCFQKCNKIKRRFKILQ